MHPELVREVPDLNTERLLLRALRSGDAEAIFIYARDPEVARHTLWEPHQGVIDSQVFLDFAADQLRSGRMYTWGITLRPDDRVIGTIGLSDYVPQHSRAELGFAIARDYWDNGITSEAAQAILRFGFTEMHLHRIEARCKPANFRSARVLEKIGMTLEGVMRERDFIKGQFEDLKLYALLRQDWQEHEQNRPAA